jgi:PAS domain S-box-containing protein
MPMEFLRRLADRNNSYAPPVVMLTGQGNENIAVSAIKLGAQDYLVKRDLTPELLQLTVRKAILQGKGYANENHRLQLQDAQQQMVEIGESVTDAHIAVDRDWRIVYANQATNRVICPLTNLAPTEFLGRSLWDLFPLLIGTDVEREFRRALTDRVAVHLEVWFEPMGSWFETHLYPAAEGLGINFRDITAAKRDEVVRKLIETERLEAEQEHDRFFNLSMDLLAIGSFEGYFVRLNPAFEEILGFTNAELMAEPFINFVHPDDQAGTIVGAKSLVAGAALVNHDNRYRCKDGSYRWIEWTAIPHAPSQVWYANGHDITERKQIEAALQASERKFSTIFEQSFELMGIVSLDGILLEINQTALDSIKAKRPDLIGQYFWDAPWWHTPQLQQQLKDAINRAGRGEFIRYEVQFPDPTGMTLTTDFSIKPVFDDTTLLWTIVAEAH